MTTMRVKFKKTSNAAPGAPTYATQGAAGADLRAAMDVTIDPGETMLVRTGIALEIPAGFEGQIRSRSGLAKIGIVVANSPGTIDSDYRGEIGVLLRNDGRSAFHLVYGARIAQLVIAPVARAEFVRADDLSDTERDVDGFGSTGI